MPNKINNVPPKRPETETPTVVDEHGEHHQADPGQARGTFVNVGRDLGEQGHCECGEFRCAAPFKGVDAQDKGRA